MLNTTNGITPLWSDFVLNTLLFMSPVRLTRPQVMVNDLSPVPLFIYLFVWPLSFVKTKPQGFPTKKKKRYV